MHMYKECQDCVGDVGNELQSLLLSKPSLDESSRLITALLRCPAKARGAAIISADGPRVLGRWLVNVPAWHTSDAALAVHIGELAKSPGSLHPVTPLHAESEPLVAVTWPLGMPNEPFGAIALVSAAHANHDALTGVIRTLAEALSIYLAGAELASGSVTAGPLPVSTQGAVMTDRQREVLTLMASGLTLAQIARRLGYSESTIRAESLNIYRYLGVHDRQHAIEVGRHLGLVGVPDVDADESAASACA